MERKDILEKFKDNAPIYAVVDEVNISEIREYATPTLEFDRKTMDIFYSLPIRDSIDDDIVDILLEEGWCLGENNNLILYLKF